MAFLEALNSHPFLKTRIALKGGTALNLFASDVPRLSVDIDINYIGAAEPEMMLAERPKVEKAVQAVCSREGLTIKRVPSEHAGGKWRLTYVASKGDSVNLGLDINFMLRTPLWPVTVTDSRPIGSFQAKQVAALDLHEIAAGKMAALFARSAARDLFDVQQIFSRKDLALAKLRLGFVVYGGISRKDWRTVSVSDVKADANRVQIELVPMLRSTLAPTRAAAATWTDKLVSDCRERLSLLLPLNNDEMEFLRRLNEEGDIAPELLTADAAMRETIREHPGLKWKALNVKKHFGLAEDAKDRV